MNMYIDAGVAENLAVKNDLTTNYQSANKIDLIAAAAVQTVAKTDVILHAFDWPYSEVAICAEEIASLGYSSVLVSPPMKSYKLDEGTDWWQRYQPQDYRIIDNQLGNTEDFSNMIKALSRSAVNVYADVVFNHMANEFHKRADLQFPSDRDLQSYGHNWDEYQSQLLFGDLRRPLFNEEHFVQAFTINNWKDRWQVQNGRITGGPGDPGLPKLRVCDYVVEQQKYYLKALKAMGVKGFRIDAAKHMTMEHLRRVWTDDIVEGMHIFGEIITDGGATKEEYETFLQPYLQHTNLCAYDFPLFHTLFAAFQAHGSMKSLVDPYCFGQALSSNRAITFAITHDIPNNDGFRSLLLNEQEEWLAYAYILGRDDGVPLVYSDRDSSGILDAGGKPRWKGAWKDPRMAKMIAFHNQVHGEPMIPILVDDELIVFARGEKGIIAINKSESAQIVALQWDRNMQDLLEEKFYRLNSGKLNLVINSKSCLMLL
ncbi:MAG: alpha-amylase family glycosyl hydrolase [Psychromonas sp.]|nr:alpha-amylase family glycosyl hydrolase [Psychromonas sp.]